VPDFPYSAALAASTIVWSDTTLNRWLMDPEALIPGQRMNVRVLSADDRTDIIAFLRRESGK
jgi:cytochrome c